MNTGFAGITSFREPFIGYGDVILRQGLVNLLDQYGEEGHPAGDMYYKRVKGAQLCAFQDKFSSYGGMNIPKGIPGVDAGDPLEFDDYRVVDRIPISEISANENCIQNPGY